MKRLLLTISLAAIAAAPVVAQKTQKTNASGDASARNDSSISKQGRQVNIQSGTQLAAQLENTLDARHAKVGDRVALKTTHDVKQDGQVIVPKGSRLIGRVTDVQQKTKNDADSVIGIAFDRLQKGSTDIPITASIVSVVQSRAQTPVGGLDSDTMSSSSTRSSGGSSSSGRSNSGGGGLLGGVGNTAGGLVNTTTSTVGNVAGGATNAVGSTVSGTTNANGSASNNLGGSLRGLQINQSSSASAQGGSTLSLTGGNLRLESGATFNLLVSSSNGTGNP
jgi:hypothetical protein